MENSEGGSSAPNGVGDPLQRLASFKGPRDLSLGGVKLNKKVFAPNLNVSRNKGKGAPVNTREKKEQTNKGKERKNDRPRRSGPNIIQSAGVFSEGLAASEKYPGITGVGGGGSGGAARGGGGSAGSRSDANVLQKPTIRPNDTIKVDKQLEEECIRRAMGGDLILDDDAKDSTRRDLPVKLPIADFRHLSVLKTPLVIVKPEPGVDTLTDRDEKPLLLGDVKIERFEDKDIVSLLRSEQSTLILMQLPDCMPGQGGSRDRLAADSTDETDESLRCRLSSLSEGRVGRLRVHRSGRVRMIIGDTQFEVILGTKAMHHQEVVSVASDPASRSARLTAVGPLQHKLTVAPDWDTLLHTTAV